MKSKALGRRGFLCGTAAAAVGAGTAPARAGDDAADFAYQVQRSDAEWRAMLSELEYNVLRGGATEPPRSSPLWVEDRPGEYCCRGCDLTLYKSLTKIRLDKGWVFFRHAFKNAVLTDIDLQGGRMGDPFAELAAGLEVHCRRCGSHLGHIVALPEVPNAPLHCINGAALRFEVTQT